MKIKIIPVSIMVILISCSSIWHREIYLIPPETPEEENYLKNVWTTALEFSVKNEEAEIIWERIQSFIGNHSSVKIQIATADVIQTYDTEYEEFGYYVTKTPGLSATTFSIRCITEPTPEDIWTEGYDYSKQAELNGHILAYYALTNEIMPKFIKR